MNSIDQERLNFEKARYLYCKELFEQCVAMKEMNEKKVQFYFAFISVFIVALFSNFSDYKKFLAPLNNQTKLCPWIFFLLVALLFLFIFFSLVSVLQSMRMHKWRGSFPPNTYSFLFSPSEHFLKEKTEQDLLEALAKQYTLAWEYNLSINMKKSKWAQISFFFVFSSIFIFFILIVILVYIHL